ncbi:carbamoyl-phosphate synthase small subunit [Vigna unguiculata]|uniref:Carbamoyl-phosphate synthase small subunit n=1 Tax=Vigna unguiculata TaxID=3917 RepID=A0A4D6LWL2_VIGUN|nr:carbamoyl-phosphate synthase small subunit [Vigna unguiculata]
MLNFLSAGHYARSHTSDLLKHRTGAKFFHIPPSDTAPDTFLTHSAALRDSLLCAIPAFLLHPRRRWPPRNTKAECNSPLTASRFSSTVTSTTSLAAASKRSAVHGERRATIGLRFADDFDRHDHHEDRLSQDGSLIGVFSMENSKIDEQLLQMSKSWDIVGKSC